MAKQPVFVSVTGCSTALAIVLLAQPAAAGVQLWGVNDLGEIVGAGVTGPVITEASGFLLKPGGVQPIQYPGALLTTPMDINNGGVVAGQYAWGAGNYWPHGFTSEAGAYETVPIPPGGIASWTTSINDAGVLAGGVDMATTIAGYIYDNGAYEIVQYEGRYSWLTGLNNHGDAVGYYLGPGLQRRGFIYSNGAYTDFEYVAGFDTYLTGINDNGDLTGYSSNGHSFIYSGGVFTDLHLAGGAVYLQDINNLGLAVGYRTLANGDFCGVTYQGGKLDGVGCNIQGIPEPSTWGLLLMGFGALGLMLRRATGRRAAVA